MNLTKQRPLGYYSSSSLFFPEMTVQEGYFAGAFNASFLHQI
jgi:hypothetical protein